MIVSLLVTRQYITQRGETKKLLAGLAAAFAGKNLHGLLNPTGTTVAPPESSGYTGPITVAAGRVMDVQTAALPKFNSVTVKSVEAISMQAGSPCTTSQLAFVAPGTGETKDEFFRSNPRWHKRYGRFVSPEQDTPTYETNLPPMGLTP